MDAVRLMGEQYRRCSREKQEYRHCPGGRSVTIKHLDCFFGILLGEMSSPHSHRQQPNSSVLRDIEALVVDAGVPPASVLEPLQQLLDRVADPTRALNNLDRFLRAGFSTAVIRDFAAQRVLLEIAVELFSQSQFLADILVRDPELFRWLTTSGSLREAKTRAQFMTEATQAAELFQRTERKLDSLKRYHRRELLRLGGREILGAGSAPEIMAELSWLADAIVESVLQIALHQMEVRTGVRFESQLAVIGLGKLGGEELNFSSDIDLLFVYDRDGDLNLPVERIHSFHELYVRIAEMMVRMLTERTEQGHLYRVDLRLRPDGSAGPLALSRAAYRAYYETRGELWERQMLTKARVIAGNRSVGEQWMEDIRPFVYPRTLLKSPIEEIYSMKQRIEAKLRDRDNIKLGSGGIRDIEFIVQALQLLNGGAEPRVCERNTLRALQALRELEKISAEEHETLAQAYLFLRRVEHRLQLLHGLQTHSLPEEAQEIEQLARRLGFQSISGFQRTLHHHRAAVRKIFESFFVPSKTRQRESRAGLTREDSLQSVLGELGLDDVARGHVERTVERFGVPWFVARNLRVLLQPGRIRLLTEAFKNRKLAQLLIALCARSSVLVERLAREPLLMESLVGQTDRMMGPEPAWQFLRGTDLLRFKEYNEFKACVRFMAGKSNVTRFREELSILAEEIVSDLYTIATQKVSENISLPPMTLLALGRLGSRGINLGSDLDLLLVYDDADAEGGLASERILKELLRLNETPRGKVYEIDFRLRPEGKNAPLAVALSYLKSYYETRAELWERQTLTRARVLTGSQAMNERVQRLLLKICYRDPLPPRWARSIVMMRKRMEQERGSEGSRFINVKLDRGGIADLEFIIHSLQLRFGGKLAGLRRGKENDILRRAVRAKVLPRTVANQVLRNLEYLHTVETYCRLNGMGSTVDTGSNLLELYARAMNEPDARSFLRAVRTIQRTNRKFLLQLLRAWEK